MEYTLTISLPKNTENLPGFYFGYVIASQCGAAQNYPEVDDVNDFLDDLVSFSTNVIFNNLTYNVFSNEDDWTITLTGISNEGCVPYGLSINIDEEISYGAPFTSQAPTPCNDCQGVNLPDCTDPELSLPIDDGTYTVSIQDHTSGNIYTQSIEVSDGGVEWNGTNTAGVFTPYSVFTVTLQDDNGDPVTWTSGYVDYNCVRLTFTPTTDTTPDA